MSETTPHRVTRLLGQIREGNAKASEELLPLVYNELRRLAQGRMAKERPGHTLQPTALVHEAYLRLAGGGGGHWQNRAHFFGAAAEAMRRILVERARRYARLKRGENAARVSLGEKLVQTEADCEELLAVDQALERLQNLDPVMGKVVNLRYFSGMTIEETAEVLHVSPRTVNRLWTGARAWLYRALSEPAKGNA